MRIYFASARRKAATFNLYHRIDRPIGIILCDDLTKDEMRTLTVRSKSVSHGASFSRSVRGRSPPDAWRIITRLSGVIQRRLMIS